MPNLFLDAKRTDRWEVGLPELNMDQLRAPECLAWLKAEGKPADVTLGSFALSAMFNDALIACIIRRRYGAVVRLLVRAWPELLTAISREQGALTLAPAPDAGQRKPPAKANGHLCVVLVLLALAFVGMPQGRSVPGVVVMCALHHSPEGAEHDQRAGIEAGGHGAGRHEARHDEQPGRIAGDRYGAGGDAQESP